MTKEYDCILLSVKANLDPASTSRRRYLFAARVGTASWSLGFCESALELRDQSRQGFRLLVRGEVTARQPLDLEPEFAEPFLREVDLPVLKGIFVAAAHQERN